MIIFHIFMYVKSSINVKQKQYMENNVNSVSVNWAQLVGIITLQYV